VAKFIFASNCIPEYSLGMRGCPESFLDEWDGFYKRKEKIMLKNLRSLKIFKVISILILFALLVGCAAVKPPSPISLNQVQSNKTGEKRGIAVVGVITWETKLVIRQNVEVTNIIKKKAKTNSVDIIEMGNIKNDQAIKNALKGHYKALILIKSDVRVKRSNIPLK